MSHRKKIGIKISSQTEGRIPSSRPNKKSFDYKELIIAIFSERGSNKRSLNPKSYS